LKPDNLLITSDFELKICDMGHSKVLKSQDEKLSCNIGTTSYQSPEQHDQRPFNPFKVDVFNIGVTLFIFATGAPAFNSAKKGDRHYDLVRSGAWKIFWRVKEQFNPLEVLTPEFKELMEGMLEVNPSRRWSLDQVMESKWVN
jgi:serine/threonine protein kinase